MGLASATGTPAGTKITNQAIGTANSVNPGQPPISVLSNTVSATVSPVCSVVVTPDGTVDAPGQSATLLPAENTTFTYQVLNTGNTENTYTLSSLTDAASAFTPTGLKMYLDANNNGVLDSAEAATSIGSVKLAANAKATVFLVVTTNDASRGDAFVNLVAACADGSAGDSNNIARVRVGQPPVISVLKTFSPTLIKPGDTTTVTVVAKNSGQGASRALMLTDALDTLAAQGLTFVKGSATARTEGTASGVTAISPEYSGDLSTFSSTEPVAVKAVRAGVASLEPAQSLILTFQMVAGPTAENKTFTNTAVATGNNISVPGSANLDVHYTPAVAIGPIGNAEVPEGTPADSQSVPFGVVGQPVCLDHTLKNTGNVTDNFKLSLSYSKGQATAAYFNLDGTPFVQPVTLQPGQSVPVRVCYTPQDGSTVLQALLTTTGDRGETNATTDIVTNIEGGLPVLTKTTTTTGTVKIGDTVTYSLSIKNPYTHALTAALAQDTLSAAHTFVSASDGGSYDSATRTVTWKLGTLQPGETRTVTLVTTVSAQAVDGQNLVNSFTLTTAEVPQQIISNEVKTPIWSATLVITKAVNTPQATFGDRLTYTLTIRNTSPTTALTGGVITDTLPAGLLYIAGTSTLADVALADPTVNGQVLTWSGLTIPASGQIKVTYAVRVTPDAVGTLVNVVVVSGNGNNATAISSNTATATVKATPLNFAPLGDIVGYVYLDRNHDGNYDFGKDKDIPMARARVILAGGRVALTDNDGRYHFASVPFGSHALRLDPASVPYLPEDRVYEGGLSGTQTVYVRGLTSVDFPLAPVSGDVQVLRRTTLTMGDLSVQKIVYVNGQQYTVQLILTTPTDLNEFELTDPLPQGATLQGDRPSLNGTLKAGETTQMYRFTWDGEQRAAVTDPSASWRY
ncbi:DUF11 domain-containing protein [Deinococcus sp. KNUC1210]|uniref:DUF11 domain-containing protein n=1 Tax=Deinococcus sp. KNUC1210 TaxID=2917691 RepID=UPI001EEFFC66|nr:DUF11 domain-containing protein [Deinococcus sp. KNUC1210]ULH14491.1 DUF11 domain-containing protein [Deinococcus sp. KNUC1210]